MSQKKERRRGETTDQVERRPDTRRQRTLEEGYRLKTGETVDPNFGNPKIVRKKTGEGLDTRVKKGQSPIAALFPDDEED